jgi:hypothetical protein
MIFAGPPLGLRPGRRWLPRLCLLLLLLLLALRIGRLRSLQPQVDGLAEVDDLEGEAGLWIRIDSMPDPDPAFFQIADPDPDPNAAPDPVPDPGIDDQK